MPRIWTHGVWTVKAGREDEFVDAWQAMAQGAMEELHPREAPHLLRDRDQPNVFRSFGYWEEAEEIERFRSFIQPHLQRIRELTESIEVFALDEINFDAERGL
jgi:heme-degrading monooxygenase HmoA